MIQLLLADTTLETLVPPAYVQASARCKSWLRSGLRAYQSRYDKDAPMITAFTIYNVMLLAALFGLLSWYSKLKRL